MKDNAIRLGYAKKKDAHVQETAAPTEHNYEDSLEHRSGEEDKIQIISFFLDTVEYAFEVNDAVEVLRPRAVTEVPRTPEFIKGILSVRGEMVPVMDLKQRLRIGAVNGRGGRILITLIDDLKAGFIVDKLSGVKEVPASSLAPVDGDGQGAGAEFLKGIIRVKDVEIRLLSAVKLIEFDSMK
ncbi:MAG: chemotaxis protein CheW [Thermodesulfobacteriota bacterium]